MLLKLIYQLALFSYTDLVPLLVAGVAHRVVVVPPGALARARSLAVAVCASPTPFALPAILGHRRHLGAETVGVVGPVTHVTQQIPAKCVVMICINIMNHS